MSYDICILDDKGSPIYQVSLSVVEHYSLLEESNKNSLVMFSRIVDYYTDVEFSAEEIHLLKKEIEILQVSINQENVLSGKLVELINLCNLAEKNKFGIYTIAD